MTATEDAFHPRTGLPAREIREVLTAMEASRWADIVVTVGDSVISVSRGDARHAVPVPPAGTPDPPMALAAPEGQTVVITAPSVGVVSRGRGPSQTPVAVGTSVRAGDVLCTVRVLDVSEAVIAGLDGTVTAIHVDDAAPVQYGAPLLSISPS